jgi:hypothetical protein
MMQSKKDQVEKQQKEQTQTLQTAGIFAAMNVVLAPLWLAESGISKGLAFVANIALLFQLHEYGKSNRPIDNTLHNTSAFFSPIIPNSTPTIDSIENAVSNIIEGGSATVNEFNSKISKK